MVLVWLGPTIDVLRQDFLTVEPDGERIVATEGDRQLDGSGNCNFAMQIDGGPDPVLRLEQVSQVVDGAIGKVAFFPDSLFPALAVVAGLQIDLRFNRMRRLETAAAGVVEGT